MSGNNVLTILYYLLVTICVLISLVLSYFGYLTNFGQLTLPFVIAIGIGLFGADILIRARKIAGRNMTSAILLFSFFALFSAVSNFNFLYTNFMKQDVIRAAISSALTDFRRDITQTRSSLEDMEIMRYDASQRIELRRELDRLRDQITDPLRPGCGIRCEEHVSNIERLLGKPLSDIARPALGTDARVVNDWYERISESVINDFEAGFAGNQSSSVKDLIQDIDSYLLQYNSIQGPGSGSPLALAILTTLSKASIDVQRRANALLGKDEQVSHKPIDVTLGRLGEIVYSLENAFVERPNIGATIAASILAVVVDVFPVFFALVAFTPDPTGRLSHQGPSRKRSGRVL